MSASCLEEDLDDFSVENKDRPAESLVRAHRAESTDEWTAGSGITTKIQPLFGGSTSWFTDDELMTGWILQCLKQKNEAQHGRRDLSETQKKTS